jgi:hypothetical protein
MPLVEAPAEELSKSKLKPMATMGMTEKRARRPAGKYIEIPHFAKFMFKIAAERTWPHKMELVVPSGRQHSWIS